MDQFEWDETKRLANLAKHGVDFSEVANFDFDTATHEVDRRHDYGEDRTISTGYLQGRLHVLCWTARGTSYRVISLRKANEREQESYRQATG